MFDRYARGGRSLQVQTKGNYWAGRAALAAGQFQNGEQLFPARRGLSRTVLRPAGARAARPLGRRRPRRAAAICDDRSAARSLQQPAAGPGRSAARPAGPVDRAGAVRPRAGRIARQRRRPQPRGRARPADRPPGPCRCGPPEWRGSRARCSTSARPIRRCRRSVSGELWSLAHGISRQESSFDPYAISHAGARGMMQLMPGTAREQAGKMGVGYRQLPADQRPQLQRDARLGLLPADAQHLGRQRSACGRELQRRLRQCPQMGRRIWRSARPGRRAQVDRGDPVRRDPGLCAAGDREQRRL